MNKHQIKAAPKTSAPVEEHKRHAEKFLEIEDYKQPRDGQKVDTDSVPEEEEGTEDG